MYIMSIISAVNYMYVPCYGYTEFTISAHMLAYSTDMYNVNNPQHTFELRATILGLFVCVSGTLIE